MHVTRWTYPDPVPVPGLVSCPNFPLQTASTVLESTLGSAQLPGHTTVYGRVSGMRSVCSTALCPHASVSQDAHGAMHLVNRSPYSGSDSLMG